MTIEWVDATERVPDSRRAVVAWVRHLVVTWPLGRRSWCVTKYNASGRADSGSFDCEGHMWRPLKVTHWADIDGPADA